MRNIIGMGLPQPPITRVAWARSGALGDLLVSLSSLIEAHVRFPQAKISVIGPKLFTEILHPKQYPFVNEIAAIEKRGSVAEIFKPVGDRYISSGEKISIFPYMKKFEAVVNLRIDSLRFAIPAFAAGVPIRIGSAPVFWSWLFTHYAPWFGKDPVIHERDAPLLLLEMAKEGSYLDRFRQDHKPWLQDYVRASRIISRWKQIGLPRAIPPQVGLKRSGVFINPTSSRREKAWPSDRFAALASELKSRGHKVQILGAPNETEWLKEVAKDEFEIVQPPHLRQVFEVLEGAELLVTNTSSLQYAAATVGTPVVTLMGRARHEIWGPVGPNDRYVKANIETFESPGIFAQEIEAYRKIHFPIVLSAVDAVLAPKTGI